MEEKGVLINYEMPAPLLVSYADAAQLLGGVSTRHISRLVQIRKLKSVGKGKARRILYRSILDYIKQEAK